MTLFLQTAFFLSSILSISLAYASESKNSYVRQEVQFKNKSLTLGGILYKPYGEGPFPTVLYNHGSAPGALNNQAAEILGPLYAKHGWVYFMPYRRGQGLSMEAGPYIMDAVEKVQQQHGPQKASQKLIELLSTDHLNDTMAGYNWIIKEGFVKKSQIAVAGNSFGGILTVLATNKISFCAAINASGAAQTWSESVDLQKLMKSSVRSSRSPIFFFQAQNDYSLEPSKVLSEEMKKARKTAEVKFYPAYGNSPQEGHSFAYKGAATWEADVFLFLKKYCVK